MQHSSRRLGLLETPSGPGGGRSPAWRCLAAAALSLICAIPSAHAQRLSPLAPKPDWSELDQFQDKITHDEFVSLLDHVYAPNAAAKDFIEILPDEAHIKTQLTPPVLQTLHFAKDSASEKPAPNFWRPADAMPASTEQDRPLSGVKIAIDAGHLGGAWAKMEERFFQLETGQPIAEGEMTLKVAQLLAPKLEAMGAKVTLVRRAPGPTTPDRPETLRDKAREELQTQGIANPRETYSDPNEPGRGETVQSESELLFYRTSEIRHRADVVNSEIKPDVTVCLHFNAEPWGDPQHPELSTANHLHVILNGCYSASELRNDDVRFDMLMKLLSRSFPEELGLCTQVAASMAKATGLPPYTYLTGNAISVDNNPYLWARNLLANRLYRTPVVFIEPYVMNSQNVWERVQAGDYEGEQMVAGAMRKSIYREYADGVAEGLKNYYLQTRKPAGNH